MRTVAKIFGILSLSAVLLSGCGTDEVGMAKVQVSLIDAPADYEAVFIEILDVQVNASGDETKGWVSLQGAELGVFDLLKLTNGEEAFLGEIELPAGNLGQVRLVLGTNNQLTTNGSTINMSVPSGAESGLKLNVHTSIEEGITYKLILDFDAARSVVKSGTSGRYNLKPVIRAAFEAQTGAINGVVAPADAAAVVYAIQGTDTVSTYPEASGEFLLRALDAGTYTVTAVPSETSGFQAVSIEGVQVEIGVVAQIDTLQFVN